MSEIDVTYKLLDHSGENEKTFDSFFTFFSFRNRTDLFHLFEVIIRVWRITLVLTAPTEEYELRLVS